MCLATLNNEAPKPTGFGWKVFKKSGNGKSLIPSVQDHDAYEYDKWYEASGDRLVTENFPQMLYPTGFHIALRREDARDFLRSYFAGENEVIRKVEYRGAHTAGEGSSFFQGSQVIAAEIKILKPGPGGSRYAKDKYKIKEARRQLDRIVDQIVTSNFI